MLFSSLLLLLCLSGKISTQKIVGGVKTDIVNFPFQVVTILHGTPDCGGSIYSPRIIITAAHCVAKDEIINATVRAGSSFWRSGGVNVNIANTRYHPHFQSATFANDIALIALQEPLTYSNKIKNIELATHSPHEGDIGYVSGYGRVHPQKRVLDETLQYAELQVLSRDTCSSPPYKYPSHWIKEDMFCATGGYSDSCSGDSGGPFVVDGLLTGIVSNGPSVCGNPNRPGLYADIAYHRSWIISNAMEMEAELQ